MHQPINQVRLRGFLTESARLFVSRSGQPRLAFRLEVWIDDQSLPPKKPAGVDYFSVVAFGSQFVGLAAELVRGREVSVSGRLRSRDLDTLRSRLSRKSWRRKSRCWRLALRRSASDRSSRPGTKLARNLTTVERGGHQGQPAQPCQPQRRWMPHGDVTGNRRPGRIATRLAFTPCASLRGRRRAPSGVTRGATLFPNQR